MNDIKIRLKQLLINKGIIGPSGKRKSCWTKYFDTECQELFSSYKSNYRSEEEAWFCLIHDQEVPICGVCHQNLCTFTGRIHTTIPGYSLVCDKCSANQLATKIEKCKISYSKRTPEQKKETRLKTRKTCLERYGEENYGLWGSVSFKKKMDKKYGNPLYNNREKASATCILKYAVKHNFQLFDAKEKNLSYWRNHRKELMDKRKNTCQEKYGVDHFFQSDEFKSKTKLTLEEKYGDIQSAYKERIEIIKKSKQEKYGDKYYHNVGQFKDTLEANHTLFENENDCTRKSVVINKFGQGWFSLNIPELSNGRFKYIENKYLDTIKEYSNEIHHIKQISNKEQQLYEFIKSTIGDKYRIYKNTRKIIQINDKFYELDIYIPKLKLAFEFNGSYWHSSDRKDKYYHQTKTKICYEQGIQLVHIYEYDWDIHQTEIQQHIKELLEGKDCTKYNWIPVKKYSKYVLSEPNLIILNEGLTNELRIYDEGKFMIKN